MVSVSLYCCMSAWEEGSAANVKVSWFVTNFHCWSSSNHPVFSFFFFFLKLTVCGFTVKKKIRHFRIGLCVHSIIQLLIWYFNTTVWSFLLGVSPGNHFFKIYFPVFIFRKLLSTLLYVLFYRKEVCKILLNSFYLWAWIAFRLEWFPQNFVGLPNPAVYFIC